MKVGIYYPYIPQKYGGGHTITNDIFQSIIEYADDSNHTYAILSESRPENIGNINYVQLPTNQRLNYLTKLSAELFRNLLIKHKFLTRIEKLIVKNNIDIMLYLAQPSPASCLTMEIPFITIVWDLQHRLQPYFPEVTVQGQWSKRERNFSNILRRASAIITGTESGKKEIQSFYQIPAERIKILPHPTPSFAIKNNRVSDNSVLKKYNLPKNYLFYPAQFWPHKNHVGLLRAVQYLKEVHDIIIPLVFVGSERGNYQFIMQLISDLELSEQVFSLGFVPNQDLFLLYKNAFALTYMTFFGPENLPPLEAFALGCPVIASNVSGAQEQLVDAALLVNPTNEVEIAHAIMSLQDNPDLREQLISKGKEKALRFTGQQFAQGLSSILDEIEPFRRCWSSSEPYQYI